MKGTFTKGEGNQQKLLRNRNKWLLHEASGQKALGRGNVTNSSREDNDDDDDTELLLRRTRTWRRQWQWELFVMLIRESGESEFWLAQLGFVLKL